MLEASPDPVALEEEVPSVEEESGRVVVRGVLLDSRDRLPMAGAHLALHHAG